jgi:hypothetical protein
VVAIRQQKARFQEQLIVLRDVILEWELPHSISYLFHLDA